MEQVVAWPGPDGPGYVNLHWKTPHLGHNGKPIWGGKPFKTINEFMGCAQWAAGSPAYVRDIFFCLSVQSSIGHTKNGKVTVARSAATATLLKAIWLDVDVGKDKGYATVEDALRAISKFYQDACLPAPSAYVFSGGGVHAYWISDVPLSVSDWRPYAEGLRAEASRLGLKFDEGVTTDEARILRVPGTFNYKTTPPRACRLAGLGRPHNFAVDLGRLATVAPVKITAAVTRSALPGYHIPACMAGLNPTLDSLALGINVHDETPLNPDGMIKNCPHIQEAMVTGGADYSQGLWMLDVLVTTFLDDGRTWAHYMSKGHTTYDKGADTQAMYERKVQDRKDRGLGWPSCQAFENEGCKLCKTCVFKGTIKSPLNLAAREQPAPALPLAPAPPTDLSLPPGYGVDAEGFIVIWVEQKATHGTALAPRAVRFFNYKVHTPNSRGGANSAFTFKAIVDIDTTKVITILDAELATEQTLAQTLCRQRCHPNPEGQKHLVKYMRAWVQRRDEEMKRQDTVPYGWQFENGERVGFAYGGKVFMDTGEVRTAGHSDPTINEAYMPEGDAKAFMALIQIITSQKQPGIEVLVAAAFAAPLMAISGEDNGIIWGQSPESGAHKSTSILTGAGVWGNPKQAKEKSTTSVLYLEDKLGTLRNLPVVLDEIRESKQVDNISAHLGNFTEGSSGGKKRRDRTNHEKKEWQTLMVVGSNKSLRDHTMKNNKDTDAALMRVFEFELPKLPDTHDGSMIRRLVAALSINYGQVGLKYAEHLGKNHKAIFEYGIKQVKGFQTEVKFTSEARFWSALCTSVIHGAHHANVVLEHEFFHVDLIHDFLVKCYEEQREYAHRNVNVGGSALNVTDTLGQFFKHVADHMLWTETLPKGGRGRPGTVTCVKLHERLPVHVRWSQQDQVLQLSKEALSDFCAKVYNTPFNSIWRGLEKNFAAEQLRVSLSAGVHSIGQGNEAVIQIAVPPSSPFYDILMTGKAPTALPGGPVGLRMTNGNEAALSAAVKQSVVDLALVRGMTGTAG